MPALFSRRCERALSESNLDLAKALAIATEAEAITRCVSQLQATNSDTRTRFEAGSRLVPEAAIERRTLVEFRSARGVGSPRRAHVYRCGEWKNDGGYR